MERWEYLVRLVKEFYEKFGQKDKIGVYYLGVERVKLRSKWFEEEYLEYKEALKNNDEVEILDAIVDMAYIHIGTLLERYGKVDTVCDHIYFDRDDKMDFIWQCIRTHGYNKIFVEAFEEVHRSNMSKLDANGNVVYKADGKIGKSELFEEPKLRPFIERLEKGVD